MTQSKSPPESSPSNSKKLSTQPYKGTRDFYPDEMRFRRWMFQKLRTQIESFGFEEYDGPLLEPFDLYASKTSDEIVHQQLYAFTDRGDRKVAIRPEMTPTLARMVAAKLHELPRPIRWYSIPNLWRYERPQRGRLREHWQLNVDILGGDRALADLEILLAAANLLPALGAPAGSFRLRVNHRKLLDLFFEHELQLSPELAAPVSRLLDAKDKMTAPAFSSALAALGLSISHEQMIHTYLARNHADLVKFISNLPEPDSELTLFAANVERVQTLAPHALITYDPSIIRGFEYYTGLVFEVFDEHPENRRAMFGGGRYDGLVGMFGKEQLSGIGFGMGDVTLQNFLQTHGLTPEFGLRNDVFIALTGEHELSPALELAQTLRQSGRNVVTSLQVGGLGAQIKTATRLGARCLLWLAETEYARGDCIIKDLATSEQFEVPLTQIAHWIDIRIPISSPQVSRP